MTPKEKAKKLVDNFFIEEIKYYENKNTAKQCALIAVDEILQNFGQLTEGANFYTSYNTIKFYQEVKHELTKQQEQ
jgi:hypothetical protein